MADFEDILKMLWQAPDSQIDVHIRDRLHDMEKLTKAEQMQELRNIIMECRFKSLASDFAMEAMLTLYNMMVEEWGQKPMYGDYRS